MALASRNQNLAWAGPVGVPPTIAKIVKLTKQEKLRQKLLRQERVVLRPKVGREWDELAAESGPNWRPKVGQNGGHKWAQERSVVEIGCCVGVAVWACKIITKFEQNVIAIGLEGLIFT